MSNVILKSVIFELYNKNILFSSLFYGIVFKSVVLILQKILLVVCYLINSIDIFEELVYQECDRTWKNSDS